MGKAIQVEPGGDRAEQLTFCYSHPALGAIYQLQPNPATGGNGIDRLVCRFEFPVFPYAKTNHIRQYGIQVEAAVITSSWRRPNGPAHVFSNKLNQYPAARLWR